MWSILLTFLLLLYVGYFLFQQVLMLSFKYQNNWSWFELWICVNIIILYH
jgi:hypothetical protein